MSGRALVVRADASPEVGAGHVMRCITLAEAWSKEGLGTPILWGSVSIQFVEARLRESGIGLIESAPSDPSCVLIVDTYDDAVRRSMLSAPAKLRVLADDLGAPASGYDVLWNPNAYSADSLYPGFKGRVLSGERVVPIRSGLPCWNGQSSDVAITLGGATPADWLIDGLAEWSTRLAHPPVSAECSWLPGRWSTVAADAMWIAFARSSMLITSAGTTVWEAANVGIPVCLILTAPNQQLIAEWATKHGVPVVDALRERDPNDFVASITAASTQAIVLPHLTSGARFVARTLGGLA